MLVKLKDPSKVWYDREQRLVLTGDKVIATKATGKIRQLLNSGVLKEVVRTQPKPLEGLDGKNKDLNKDKA